MKKILIGFVLLIVLLASPVYAQEGLVSHWSFDNPSNPGQDDVGVNDGTVYGATWTTDGFKNGAMSFDGSDDISITENTPLNFTGPFSYGAWFKKNDLDSYGGVFTRCRAPGESSTGYALVVQFNNRISCFYMNGSDDNYVISDKVISTDTWYHAVCVWNGSIMLLYVNGTEQQDKGDLNSINQSSGSAYIGRFYIYATTLRWNGTIDELRIYNRSLSSEEVLEHYNEGIGNYSEADLNEDGVVDILDLTIITTHFGQTESHQDWNATADVIRDGEIDIYDVVFETSRFSGAPSPCTYTCRDNQCSSYDDCNPEEDECPSGQFCCSGNCTTPPPPCPTCRPSTCDSYVNCTNASGTCTSGYCCSGNCTQPTNGTIIYASSCSRNDIQAAVDSAIIGYTVMIPACTENDFTGTVTVPAGIEIQGQGPTETILRRSSYENVPLFEFDGSNGEEIKFSGIKLQGTYTQDQTERGLNLINDPVNFRVWNCEFEDFPYYGVQVHGDPVSGVIWNCTFKDNARPGYGYGVLVRGDTSGDSQLGDNSWGRDDLLGTSDGVYIEDCTFSNSRHYVTGTYGGRFIIRYCTIEANTTVDASAHALDTHGSGPVSGTRGGRKFEVYENTITLYQPQYYPMFYKGGHGVIFNNTITNIVYQRDWCLFGHVCCGQNNCLTWPHRDMCTDIYIWGNSVNGESNNHPRESSQCNDEEDAPIHRQDRDWFEYEMPGYTPYPYPHPLREGM